MSREKLNNTQIKNLFNELFDDKKYTPNKRGFEFEKLIKAKLENEFLEPRASYKPRGEQIDGSFFWQGQTFLLEAKWVNSKLPASSIYAFKGKLDGKFHTSSGVFFAVNGYSDDVEDALKFGKSLNVILFDTNDISLIFNGDVTFIEVLKFKLREAGDTGSLNVPYRLKNKIEKMSESFDIRYFNLSTFNKKYSKLTESEDLLIFVEGRKDVQIIEELLKPLEIGNQLSYKIVVLDGVNNIRQLPSLLNLYANHHQTKGVIVILDDDQATIHVKNIIERVSEQLENSSIPIYTKFFFIDEQLKKILVNIDSNNLLFNSYFFTKFQLYNYLKIFIENILTDYYDPEVDIPRETLKKKMQNAKWNFKNVEIKFENFEQDLKIESIEDLIQYLNEEVISEMDGSMPLYWLKEQDYLNYENEVREYLLENHKSDLKKMKWNINEL